VSSVSINKICSPDFRSSVRIAASSEIRSGKYDKVFRPPSPSQRHFRPSDLHKGHFTRSAGPVSWTSSSPRHHLQYCVALNQGHFVTTSLRHHVTSSPRVVPAWEVLAQDRAGWRGGLKSLRVNECE
jgi:hypothetical protein